jgi:5-bromo-4-chloroindolyl phosphate hydrolysis protein
MQALMLQQEAIASLFLRHPTLNLPMKMWWLKTWGPQQINQVEEYLFRKLVNAILLTQLVAYSALVITACLLS